MSEAERIDASEEGFIAHFHSEYGRIVRELDLILGDHEAACEVAQEAFIKQYSNWPRVARYDRPGAWVRRVAFRIAHRQRRRYFKMFSGTEPLDDHAVDAPSTERVMDVRNAVLQLPLQQRSAVVLHYYRDLTVLQVADAMGCGEGSVKTHLSRARQKLAELLSSYRPA